MSKTTIVKEGGNGGVPPPNPSGAQWTVIGLLVLLFGLEMMRSQYMRDAYKFFMAQFNTNLSAKPGQGPPLFVPSPPKKGPSKK